jgi:hypothetical protein
MSEKEVKFSVPFDVIELPSKGLLYKDCGETIKVEYMTAEDENILTSPNLLQSGKVLDVLMDRKIKQKGMNAKDLLVGDRNAIMVFLRATAYGEMYPVKLTDPTTGEEFETEIDLNTLKIKVRMLTAKDEEDLVKGEERRQKILKNDVSKLLTSRLTTQIMEVDGETNKGYIEQFVQYLPAGDSLELRKYMDDIEPGIDLRVDVEAPSGAGFRSIVPITVRFFWPNVEL